MQLKHVAIALLAATLCAARAANAHAQTVTGTVTESGVATPIRGASVRISGSALVVTDANGRFRVEGVFPGSHTVGVEAVGYKARLFDVVLRTDTSIAIQLERAPVAIDSLVIKAQTVSIKGTIISQATGLPLLEAASATLYPGSRTVGARSGHFTIPNVPRGDSVTIVVEGAEHLPARISLVADSDTSFEIVLRVDSVALRMIAEQVKRLAKRAQAVPMSLRSVGRDEIAQSRIMTVREMLARKMTPSRIAPDTAAMMGWCYFLDDRHVEPALILNSIAELVERIEVYGDGKMVRVYTKRYVARMTSQPRLNGVFYSPIGVRTVCN